MSLGRFRIGGAALLLMASAATAATAAAEPVELKVWHSYTGTERKGFESSIAAFESSATSDFTIATSFVPYDALVDKLGAALPRGHGPDVFVFAHDRVGGWAEGRLVEPIELFVDEAMLDRHTTPCVFALAYGDSLYGLPLAFKAQALFVRTDMIETPPRDFESLLALAKKHTNADTGHFGFVYPNADLFFHTPLLFSLGGALYGDDPKSPAVVNDGLIASLALAHRLKAIEGILPDDPTPVVATSMFSEGRTPIAQSGPWFRGEIDEGVPYTVVPIPAYPGGQPSSGFSTCEGLMMSRYTKHKRRAFELMRFITTTIEGAKPRMTTGRQTVTLDEAWQVVLPTLPESEQAIFTAFKTAFSQSTPSPSDPTMNAVWTPMNAALYKTLHRGMAPKDAAEQAQKRIDKALRK